MHEMHLPCHGRGDSRAFVHDVQTRDPAQANLPISCTARTISAGGIWIGAP
jgi:hypothetical protein